MELYTIQIAQWRKAKASSIPLLDITFKQGTLLSPTKQLVEAYKYGGLSEADYTLQYTETLRLQYKQDLEKWLSFINQSSVAIACYCPAGDFCHRLIAKDIVELVCKANNVPYTYLGEIT